MEQREAARRVVLFDFDGVLIRGDAFSLFMRDRYARARWRTALVLLSSPWLLLVLPFSRRRVMRTLVHLGLLGVDEARFGMRLERHNLGRRQLQLLAQNGIEAWHVAYSDSHRDLPMLAGAAEAVLVNATPRLCKRVEKALGRSVTRADWN
jgi:phosphoserine phosphatase